MDILKFEIIKESLFFLNNGKKAWLLFWVLKRILLFSKILGFSVAILGIGGEAKAAIDIWPKFEIWEEFKDFVSIIISIFSVRLEANWMESR